MDVQRVASEAASGCSTTASIKHLIESSAVKPYFILISEFGLELVVFGLMQEFPFD